ncbi:MAG: NGG1p interacting factor NIF3, partial [Pseudomonas sp.]
MYKLAFFVPPSHVEVVKAAVFAAGGGRIGDYDCCAWQVLGQGQ